MSVLPSSLVLPPPSLQRDMASIIEQITPAQTTAQQQQDNTTPAATPSPTRQPATTPQQQQQQDPPTPTEQTHEQPKETQKAPEQEATTTTTKAAKEGGDPKEPTTTTAATPTTPPSAPAPLASATDTAPVSMQPQEQGSPPASSLVYVSVGPSSSSLSVLLVPAPSSSFNTNVGPQTISAPAGSTGVGVRPSQSMDLPGLVMGSSQPMPTSAATSSSNTNDPSGSASSNQLDGASSSAQAASHKPGPGAVFGLVALACVGIMACLFAARKVSAWRARRAGGGGAGGGVLLGVYPAGRDEKGGGGGGGGGTWKNLGSPMERASSWFGVDGAGAGGEKGSPSMRYGKSRDSIWSLAQGGGNRAGLGTGSVGTPARGAAGGHYQTRAGSPSSVLPAMPSRAAGISASSSSATTAKSPLAANSAYVLTYSDPPTSDPNHYAATHSQGGQRPTLAGLSNSSSYTSKHTGGGKSSQSGSGGGSGGGGNGRSPHPPPPTPLASSSVCSSIVEMVETGGPVNTSNYPSTEDLLSPSQSSVFTSHHHQHQQLHYPSRNPSISSSAGGRGLGVPRGGTGARPSSDASNYSSAAGEMDTAWGKGGGVGGGGEARGRLYDAVMSQGQQGQGGRI